MLYILSFSHDFPVMRDMSYMLDILFISYMLYMLSVYDMCRMSQMLFMLYIFFILTMSFISFMSAILFMLFIIIINSSISSIISRFHCGCRSPLNSVNAGFDALLMWFGKDCLHFCSVFHPIGYEMSL